MNIAEVGTGYYDFGLNQSAPSTGTITPVADQPYYIAVKCEDVGLAVVSSIDGTGGWAQSNGATYSIKGTYTGTNLTISVISCVPGTSTDGVITPTFSETASRSGLHISTASDGANTSIMPSSLGTNSSAGASGSVTHGTMADGTNNVLLAYFAHAQDFTSAFAMDANYTEFGASPTTFGSGGMSAGAGYIEGNSDLVCGCTWTGYFANWAAVIVEVAAGSSGTTYEEDLEEGAEAGDTMAGVLELAGAISERINAGETMASTLQSVGAVSEGATAGETLEVAWTAVSSIAEGALAGDQVAGAATFLSAVVESANAGDTLSGQLLLALAWAEGVDAGDAFAGVLDTIEEGVSEGIISSDTYAAIQSHAAAYQEGALAGDAVAAIRTIGLAVTEGIAAGESITGSILFDFPAEGALAGDAVAAQVDGAGSVDDGAVVGDTFAAQFPGIARSVNEGATAGEVMAYAYATYAAFSDGSVASDVYTAIHQMLGTVAEGALAGSMFVSSVGVLSGTITEGAVATDAYAAGLSYVLAWSEGAAAGDAWSVTVINYLAGLKILALAMPLAEAASVELTLAESASIVLPLSG
jgi:hypothetical protein